MSVCRECLQELPANRCVIRGCVKAAEWEGWHRNRDGFGLPTGSIYVAQVCEEHKPFLDVVDMRDKEAVEPPE